MIRIPGPLPTVDSSSTRIEVSAASKPTACADRPVFEGVTPVAIREPGATRFAQDLIAAAKKGTPLQRPEALRQSVRNMPSVEQVPTDWAASLASDLARLTD